MSKIVVVLKFLLEGEMAVKLVGDGIVCGRDALGSVWNRVLRCVDWRGGRGGPTLVGLGGVGSGEMFGSGLLSTLETHFWRSDVGDPFACGYSILDSDLFRVWIAVFERISPLKPSNALCLLILFIFALLFVSIYANI